VLLMVIMACWGLNIPAVKVIASVMDVAWAGALRMVLAAGVLCLIVWYRHRAWPRLTRHQWAWMVLAGFFLVYANQLFFVRGMMFATATNASLITALTPSMSLVAAALVFRDRIRPLMALGVLVGFVGVGLVTFKSPGASLHPAGLGELYLVLGLLVFVIGGLVVQRVSAGMDALTVGWGVYTTGSFMLCVHLYAVGGAREAMEQIQDPVVLGCLVYSGILGTALSNVGWYKAIGRIGILRAGAFFYWLPIFGVSFSALLLGEELTLWHLAALLLVLAGTRIGVAAQRKQPVESAPK